MVECTLRNYHMNPSPTVLYTLISNKDTANLLYAWHVCLKELICANLWQVILAIADLRNFNSGIT